MKIENTYALFSFSGKEKEKKLQLFDIINVIIKVQENIYIYVYTNYLYLLNCIIPLFDFNKTYHYLFYTELQGNEIHLIRNKTVKNIKNTNNVDNLYI